MKFSVSSYSFQRLLNNGTYTQRDLIAIAKDIDTYETSILPYEDCCTVFTPKHPKTKPILADIEKAEEPLDIDALCEEAVNGIKKIFINSDGVQNG